mmetsp:Transcript_35372/g.64756  ORF Transcript_35372/g.64756 Transcript_35372/m.64756 type:complete len:94 (-) Transcript_35372:118-399(-)
MRAFDSADNATSFCLTKELGSACQKASCPLRSTLCAGHKNACCWDSLEHELRATGLQLGQERPSLQLGLSWRDPLHWDATPRKELRLQEDGMG